MMQTSKTYQKFCHGLIGKNLFLPLITMSLVIVLMASSVYGQTGGFAGSYTRMGFGPRGMAMGNTIGTVPEEGIYAHYNPALAAFAKGNQIDIGVAAMSFDRSLNNVDATFRLPPSAGLEVGILNARVKNIDGRTQSGYSDGKFSTNEMQMFAEFGMNISNKLKGGIGIKLNYAHFYSGITSTISTGIDLGLLYQPIKPLRLGIAVQDLLSSYHWDTTNFYTLNTGEQTKDNFPTRIRFDGSWRFFDSKLIVATEYEVRIQTSRVQAVSVDTSGTAPVNVTNTTSLHTSSSQWRIGLAYRIHPRITLRAGWQFNDLHHPGYSQQPSIGFSVHLPFDRFQPSIDYAFVREPDGVANMHVFAIRFVL
jgi:hypothetical protein